MTEDEINRLADAIFERIKSFQQDLDNDFFGNLKSVVHSDLDGAYTWAVSEEEFASEVLQQLNKKLSAAVEQENYQEAYKLQKEIEDLKRNYPGL